MRERVGQVGSIQYIAREDRQEYGKAQENKEWGEQKKYVMWNV